MGPHREQTPPFYFGTNLKMHQTPADTARFMGALVDALGQRPVASRLFVIPPFTSLPAAAAHPARSRLWLGAQTMHWAAEGAFTGEIAPPMLAALGIDLVLLGHAERRGLFGETDEGVRRKARAAIDHGLRPLICVGETREERDWGVSEETIMRQLKIALSALPDDAGERVMIAYEPVWSIGVDGVPAEPADILGVVSAVRVWLDGRFGPGARPPILYGGSVDAGNGGLFAAMPGLDGLFVGRSAWTPDGFARVLRGAEAARFGEPSRQDEELARRER